MFSVNRPMDVVVLNDCVPGPYLDVKNVWTFGIGHTASAGPPDPAQMSRGLPDDLDAGISEAFRLFRADIVAYEAEVLRAVKVPSPSRPAFRPGR